MLENLKISKINRYFIIFYATALIARITAFIYLGQSWSLETALLSRGTLSDAACAMVFALILRFAHDGRLIFVVICAFFALACAANIANIGVNFSNLSIADTRFLQEKGFLLKSVGSFEILTLWLFFTLCLGIVYCLLEYTEARFFAWSKFLIVYMLLAGQAAWLPVDINKPFWQQYNLLEEATRALLPHEKQGLFQDSAEITAEYKRFMNLNLSGEPIKPLPDTQHPTPNVLIVSIEGLSEQFLKDDIMPNLKKLADGNMHYTNFVNHQRFTENGLYSITCGDMPTLYRQVRVSTDSNGMPFNIRTGKENSPNKWGVVGRRGSLNPCLPSILAEVGYQTAFFQASSLMFTNKKGFMKNAGMQTLLGDGLLKKAYPLTPKDKKFQGRSFGMPDGIFYPRVAKEIIKLNTHGKPWFVTLMTTSTHFPMFVAEKNNGKFKNQTLDAFYTADEALGEFLTSLETKGLLENTLLIVTGDESGASFKENTVAGMMAGNWGAMVIKTPDHFKYKSDQYFTQSDIMTSILDYLGMSGKARTGYSLFRKYSDAFRPLMFANIRTDRWFAWYAPDKMVACANYFKICQNLRVQGSLFNATLEDDVLNKELIHLYVQVARKSDFTNINLP